MATAHEQKFDALLGNDEELFNRQIAELLNSAEARLRRGGTSQSQSHSQFKQPRLNPGDLSRPYIATSGDVSRLDPSRLFKKDQRQLSNEIRKVKPPTPTKKAAEVCLSSYHYFKNKFYA